jgi:hypothetical protein
VPSSSYFSIIPTWRYPCPISSRPSSPIAYHGRRRRGGNCHKSWIARRLREFASIDQECLLIGSRSGSPPIETSLRRFGVGCLWRAWRRCTSSQAYLPWENDYAESFPSRLRDGLTNREEFTSLAEARHLADAWRLEYNHRRPHSSLGYQTPAEFAAGRAAAASAPAAPPLQKRRHGRTPRRLPLPNQYSHDPWYRKRGRPSPV